MVVEARNVTPHRTVQGQEVDDVEAGAAAGAGIDAHGSRGGGVGIVASMVRALSGTPFSPSNSRLVLERPLSAHMFGA
jgi:uncharacterized membrane protein